MWMFIHLFNPYLLNANYVLEAVDKIMNETECLYSCYSLVKGERQETIIQTAIEYFRLWSVL